MMKVLVATNIYVDYNNLFLVKKIGGSEDHRKITLISWNNDVCSRKENGRLGGEAVVEV